MSFSGRLPWRAGENALAGAEAARRAAGKEILDLTVSNPTQVGLGDASEALAAALATPALGAYLPAPFGLPEARAAVAGDYLRRGAPVEAARIVLTASTSESYALLWKLFCDPGDTVLVPAPSYPLFEWLARLEGVIARPYRLGYDGRWHVDFSTLDVDGARAIVVVSPNNPTGSYLTEEDLGRLDALAAGEGIPLIVDEVFADYPMGPPADDAVTAVAAHPTEAMVFSLGGLSKGSGLPQLKLGWMAATGPEAAVDEALRRLELVADTYLSVGAPVQLAAPRLLAIGATLRGRISGRVMENRRALGRLVGRDAPLSLFPAEAGWSAVLRVPQVMTDEAWALALLDDGVLVQPGYFFDLEAGATIVLSLLPEPATFAEGVRRILARVDASVG